MKNIFHKLVPTCEIPYHHFHILLERIGRYSDRIFEYLILCFNSFLARKRVCEALLTFSNKKCGVRGTDSNNHLEMRSALTRDQLLTFGDLEDFKNTLFDEMKNLLRASRIRSRAAYHKAIQELQRFGYLKYFPSYHPVKASEIELLNDNVHETQITCLSVKQKEFL